MVHLRRGKARIQSIFGIHGDDENDLSGGFAYALASSEVLLRAVLIEFVPGSEPDLKHVEVRIQTHRSGEGITDIEIEAPGLFFVVFEAKKGMEVPSEDQLRKYVPRCQDSGCKAQIVALTSLGHRTAEYRMGEESIEGIPVRACSWAWVRRCVSEAHAQESSRQIRWVLDQYLKFLEEFMGQERLYSNMVYVVSLGLGKPDGWNTSWIDIVEKKRRYFYSASKNWPAPPNYLGFRYHGCLQSVHHVQDFEVVPDLRARKEFSVTDQAEDWGPHYLLTLGPPIRPPREIRTGSRVRHNNRVWCMLDSLLTSETISDALSETQRRINEEAV